MLELLRAWLNGKREYSTGVALYEQCGSNETLLNLFKKGPSHFTTTKLQASLMEICLQLKEQQHEGTKSLDDMVSTGKPVYGKSRNQVAQEVVANPELYAIAKRNADLQYKEIMNMRAVLFAQLRSPDVTEPNTIDKIKLRAPEAIAIVTGFNKASHLYDVADFVKTHGHLPADGNDPEEEYDHLPDNLVKSKLDNLRKALSKLKAKEETPERVALMQQHQANIEKLEKRWASLKSMM